MAVLRRFGLGLGLRVDVHQEDASEGVECEVGGSEVCIQARDCTKEPLTAQMTSRGIESKDESSNSGEGRCSFAEGVGLYQNSDGRGKGENEVGKRGSDLCRSSDTGSEVVGN